MSDWVHIFGWDKLQDAPVARTFRHDPQKEHERTMYRSFVVGSMGRSLRESNTAIENSSFIDI